jgi:hypothetical protein
MYILLNSINCYTVNNNNLKIKNKKKRAIKIECILSICMNQWCKQCWSLNNKKIINKFLFFINKLIFLYNFCIVMIIIYIIINN